MFEAFLRDIAKTKQQSNKIFRNDFIAGVSILDFDFTSPVNSFSPAPLVTSYEILFCRFGKIRIDMKAGRSVEIEEKDIVLISDTSQIHSFKCMDERCKGILVTMDTSGTYESFRDFFTSLPLHINPIESLMSDHDGCAKILRTVRGDIGFSVLEELPAAYRGKYSLLMALEIVYLLYCKYPLAVRDISGKYYAHHQIDIIRQVHEYLSLYLESSMTIPQLAQKFCISPTLLKEGFRKIYGQSIHKYVQDCRMQKAAALLTSTSMTVLQIAGSVGYESSSQFGAMFKRHYNVTPSQYRRAVCKKNV